MHRRLGADPEAVVFFSDSICKRGLVSYLSDEESIP
jgi:hypothetical protein